jgi:hypothetical protein
MLSAILGVLGADPGLSVNYCVMKYEVTFIGPSLSSIQEHHQEQKQLNFQQSVFHHVCTLPFSPPAQRTSCSYKIYSFQHAPQQCRSPRLRSRQSYAARSRLYVVLCGLSLPKVNLLKMTMVPSNQLFQVKLWSFITRTTTRPTSTATMPPLSNSKRPSKSKTSKHRLPFNPLSTFMVADMSTIPYSGRIWHRARMEVVESQLEL